MCVLDNVHMHASLKRNHTSCVSLLLDFPYFQKVFHNYWTMEGPTTAGFTFGSASSTCDVNQ
jgi:hypothetical protein